MSEIVGATKLNHKGISYISIALALIFTLPVVGSAEDEKICFNTDRVRNFEPLSDSHLFISVRSDENYLLSIRQGCFGLRNAQVIAFKDTISQVCSNSSFADIVIRDMGRPLSCRIENIEKVENKEEAEAIAAAREQETDKD